MRRVLCVSLIACVFLCCACAVGQVSPDGTLRGIAFGQGKLEHCVTPAVGEPQCETIAGGALSVAAAEALKSALGLVRALLPSVLVEAPPPILRAPADAEPEPCIRPAKWVRI